MSRLAILIYLSDPLIFESRSTCLRFCLVRRVEELAEEGTVDLQKDVVDMEVDVEDLETRFWGEAR